MKITKCEQFERDGYLILPNLVSNPKCLYSEPFIDEFGNPKCGTASYQGNKLTFKDVDDQVEKSFSRYRYPAYKPAYDVIKENLEKDLGVELFPTYYFERFYYAGSDLKRHTDRGACEISVTLQISSNTNPWPIYFKKPDGSESCAIMNNGDAVLYKGCKIEHWRDKLKSRYNKYQRYFRRLMKRGDDTYHHQIFFHYVSAQGENVHHAFDN
tara:strand:- start:74 stop:709 length:636 start_codon:yes stop_codon:yes gene_type:complete